MGESVVVNFNGPFTFDIDEFVRGRRDDVFEPLVKVGHLPEVMPRLVDQSVVGKNVVADVNKKSLCSDEERGVECELKNQARTCSSRSAGDRATAAFVLDYLDHSGYTKALASVAESMRKRRWISPPALPDGPNLARKPSSTESRFIRFLQKLSTSDECLIRSGLTIDTIEHDARYGYSEVAMIRGALFHRVMVHDFVSRLMLAHSLAEPGRSIAADASQIDADAEEEAVIYGRSLLAASKSTRWSEEDKALLIQAFGLLGLDSFSQKLRELWRDRRSQDYEKLLTHLRGE